MTYENVLALRVSLETGLRIDDVLSLRASQVVRRTICGTAEKTDKPYKKTISADLAKRLAALTPNKGGYIFPHRLDPMRHRTRQAVWVNMKKAAVLMGVKLNAAPHSARKTYAVEMFKDKGLEQTRKELQHDRISTTMIYAFSDMLCDSQRKPQDIVDIEAFAEIIAEKVAQKLQKMLEL
jgi:integrase